MDSSRDYLAVYNDGNQYKFDSPYDIALQDDLVYTPDDYTGDGMGDLNKRRGRVLGMNPTPGVQGKTTVEAEIPMTGLYGYCTILRSMTGGRGTYEYEFIRYEQAPSDVQEKEVAARASKLTVDSAED